MVEENHNKRTSLNCNEQIYHIIQFKRFLIFLCIFIVIFPILYLIPCTTTYLEFDTVDNIGLNDFKIYSYSLEDLTYHNITITDENSSEFVQIQSIDTYFKPKYTFSNTSDMIQKITYLQSFDNENSFLKINIYSNRYNESISQLTMKELDLKVFRIIPTDYLLSYMKITLVNNPLCNESFIVDYYVYFEPRYVIRYQVITLIILSNFYFNEQNYNNWFNWNYNDSEIIPTSYPYLLDVDISQYNEITKYFNVEVI